MIQEYREKHRQRYTSNAPCPLCPPQASVTGAVLFFHCYAGPHFSAAHLSWLREAQHWKVGEYNANWGTGELSMRSPSTFLQGKKKVPLSDETRA